MDEKKSEKKPPGKISQFFSKVFSLPKKLLRLSLPARAALVVALVLVALTLTAWIVFYSNENSVRWGQSMTFWRFAGVVLLVVVIPLVAYWGLKLWLEGESSRFPDIDYAWNAGLDALERNGLDVRTIPIFLITGTAGPEQETALMDATKASFRVRGAPEGPAALHWYANPDGIYLCCTEASWTGALARLENKRATTAVASALPHLEAAAATRATPTPTAAAPAAKKSAGASAASSPSAASTRGTMMLDEFVDAQRPRPDTDSTDAAHDSPAGAAGGQAAPAQSAGAGRGTMMLETPLEPPAERPPMAAAATAPLGAGGVTLASHESAEQLQKLAYLCHLLTRSRQPLCAVNGILMTLPFKLVQSVGRASEQLEQAVSSDLTTVQKGLQLRCPVTALICGMESEPGFKELVRRVGRQRAGVQRFGRGFDLRSPATAEQLHALCAHLCGAFEDWIYTLFRQPGALNKPGNTNLYGLLCKVRFNLKNRLARLLAEGFGPGVIAGGREPLLFSGCYFASTGATEDRQAFVKGVFDKLVEEQENVEWTSLALARDRRYLWLAYAGFAAAGASGLAMAAMIGRQVVRALSG